MQQIKPRLIIGKSLPDPLFLIETDSLIHMKNAINVLHFKVPQGESSGFKL